MKIRIFDSGDYIITIYPYEMGDDNTNYIESEEIDMKKNKDLLIDSNDELKEVEGQEEEKRELTKEEKKEIRKQRTVIGCLIALVVILAIVYFSGIRFFVPQAVISFYENSDGFLRSAMDWVLKVLDFFRGILN